jgi:CRP-like cAMP-binding protein
MGHSIMTADKNAELLGGVPLFHGLSPQQLAAIAARGTKQFFEAGAAVIKNRSKSKSAYLILSGTVETRPPKSSGLEPETFEAGSLVGEMAMLTEAVATMDVIAKDRMRALSIARSDLYELMEEDPDIAFQLSDKVTERLIFLAHDLRELDARFAALEISVDDTLAALA